MPNAPRVLPRLEAPDPAPRTPADLRRVGIDPDFWYPVAQSAELAPGKTLAKAFAGEPIVLARPERGGVFALEDRCAHRQVPLSAGEVCGDRLKCCYHGWTYDAAGRCVDVPYLDANPNGVRSYPCREAGGLIFVFPGRAERAGEVAFPALPLDPRYKVLTLDYRVNCHYSFMHENLMDMNHQHLHRGLMGKIRAKLLDLRSGEDWVEADYTFERTAGSQNWGERFMLGWRKAPSVERGHDLMTVRTGYPYQTLKFWTAEGDEPALDLWNAYVPVDAAQRVNHQFGLMAVRRPSLPGVIHLLWPVIKRFTAGIFAEDRWIVEREQAAYERQQGDHNQEVFPAILRLREVLRARGVPLADEP
ncbi:MAG: Rieske 2Fe-2S domain-containing protein [Planctomycetes bacterium]|nr:Rieske 2Fe-2S domain-containing protein [Planctomycetota bacterium]